MSSVQPLSASALSSLIFELQQVESILGPNPIGSVAGNDTDTPATSGKRIYRALERLRTRVFPLVMQSTNLTQIELVRRVEASVADDPLGTRMIQTLDAVYGVVIGPSAEAMAAGFLQVGDLEVILAAYELDAAPTSKDGMRIAGTDYDVVAIRAYPQVPNPVAYRLALKKAA